MAYELRKLTSKDIFPMIRLIKKFGIAEFKKCFDPKTIASFVNSKDETSKEALESAVGMNIILEVAEIVIGNLGNCENEIFDFFASISNLKRKEIEKLPMDEFMQMIIDFVKKEEFEDFFKVVSTLLK